MPEQERIISQLKQKFIKSRPIPQLKKSVHPSDIIQKARVSPQSLISADIMQLQLSIGNRAACQLMKEIELTKRDSKTLQFMHRSRTQQIDRPLPPGFDSSRAAHCVSIANFSTSVYVNVSSISRQTKQAFTYVEIDAADGSRWRVCVVGHIHIDPSTGAYTGPGNCYIPGWNNWDMSTPDTACAAIDSLTPRGTFPEDRYPKRK